MSGEARACARQARAVRPAEMRWRLRGGLFWCDCGGRAVFLDLPADRYFCLPREANAAFLRMTRDQPDRSDRERLDPLIRRGLMIEGDSATTILPPPTVEMTQSDFPTEPGARASLRDIARMTLSELRIGWLLRRSPLHQVIERVRRDGPKPGSVQKDQSRTAQAFVSAARVTALWLRSHDRCLVRGLAMHALCRKEGLSTKLVLGVVAHPFTAHCWVQLGNKVLVGGYEQVRLYTPILVVE